MPRCVWVCGVCDICVSLQHIEHCVTNCKDPPLVCSWLILPRTGTVSFDALLNSVKAASIAGDPSPAVPPDLPDITAAESSGEPVVVRYVEMETPLIKKLLASNAMPKAFMETVKSQRPVGERSVIHPENAARRLSALSRRFTTALKPSPAYVSNNRRNTVPVNMSTASRMRLFTPGKKTGVILSTWARDPLPKNMPLLMAKEIFTVSVTPGSDSAAFAPRLTMLQVYDENLDDRDDTQSSNSSSSSDTSSDTPHTPTDTLTDTPPKVIWRSPMLPSQMEMSNSPPSIQIYLLMACLLADVRPIEFTRVSETVWAVWKGKKSDTFDPDSSLEYKNLCHYLGSEFIGCLIPDGERFEHVRLFYYTPLNTAILHALNTGRLFAFPAKKCTLKETCKAVIEAWRYMQKILKNGKNRTTRFPLEVPKHVADQFRQVPIWEAKSLVTQWAIADKIHRPWTDLKVPCSDGEFSFSLEVIFHDQVSWAESETASGERLAILAAAVYHEKPKDSKSNSDSEDKTPLQLGSDILEDVDEEMCECVILIPFTRASARVGTLRLAYEQTRHFIHQLRLLHQKDQKTTWTSFVTKKGNVHIDTPPEIGTELPSRHVSCLDIDTPDTPLTELSLTQLLGGKQTSQTAHKAPTPTTPTPTFSDQPSQMPMDFCLDPSAAPFIDDIPPQDQSVLNDREVQRYKATSPFGHRIVYVTRLTSKTEVTTLVTVISTFGLYKNRIIFKYAHITPLMTVDKDVKLHRYIIYALQVAGCYDLTLHPDNADKSAKSTGGSAQSDSTSISLNDSPAKVLMKQSALDESSNSHAYLEKISFCTFPLEPVGSLSSVRLFYWRPLRSALALNLYTGKLVRLSRPMSTVDGTVKSLIAAIHMEKSFPQFYKLNPKYELGREALRAALASSDHSTPLSPEDASKFIYSICEFEKMLLINSEYKIQSKTKNGGFVELVYCLRPIRFQHLNLCIAICVFQKGTKVNLRGLIPFFSPFETREMIHFILRRAIWFLPQLHHVHQVAEMETVNDILKNKKKTKSP
eukprot:Blabericola_migrator_1__478@NODE_1115_length_5385_cov_108_807634_g762_i0_p1_GENE_NODE_1115_length_5385_cov_108_807634_g762_i0NODE_1115_length_5385_cov_108_807634_g762_i0_p1_ORF_typecomplete_len1032_score207_31_NODE_1115_length_5385_cov_108_807634_g762_i019795074